MNPSVISVSEFLAIINETLRFAYPQVIVEGEVSSFKVNQGKFVFFDLKDETNVLSCFMMLRELKLPIEDGMKVRVVGTPKVVVKSSKFSLTVHAIELAGEGELRRAMELLKKKLGDEGLFDPARKRALPSFPRRIGVITSGTSAAYADFIKILSARWGGVDVILADVSVQGVHAPDQIVGAIEYFNHLSRPADVLVLIRGGGSLEDLMAFSMEPVARAVAASRTPTISGVGHEVDTSLTDYAADVRAATPSDAARLVVPDRHEVAARVEHLARRAEAATTAAVAARRRRTDQALARLEAYLRHPRERVAARVSQLWRGLDQLAATARRAAEQTDSLSRRLDSRQHHARENRATHLRNLERILRSLGPETVLSRGYAIVRSRGRIIRAAASAMPGDPLVIQLSKGNLEAQVKHQLCQLNPFNLKKLSPNSRKLQPGSSRLRST